jgi:hypothetical protein
VNHARRYSDAPASPAATVYRDRDTGKLIALHSVRPGQLVALAPISPPLRVRRDRELRRRGLRACLVINLWLVTLELLAVVALSWWCQ